MFSKIFFMSALVSTVLADIYITFPVSTSTMSGGSPYNITWEDDGAGTYELSTFGPAQFSLAVGGTSEQLILQVLGTDIDVSTTSMFEFTLDASVGADSDAYFIRIDSNNLTDSSNNGYAMQAFSAKYTLDSMTGEFNSTVEALVDNSTSTSTATTAATTAKTSTHSSTTKPSTATVAVAEASGTDTSAAGGFQPQLFIGAVFSAALCLFLF